MKHKPIEYSTEDEVHKSAKVMDRFVLVLIVLILITKVLL